MSAAAPDAGRLPEPGRSGEPQTLAAPAGLVSDIVAITGRAIRGILREPELFIFALIIPVFFFVVQIGALGDVAEQQLGISNYATFQLPISILFAAASTSGGNALVLDIAGGYWDKLSLTPTHRSSLVIGNLFGEMFAVLLYSLTLLLFGFVIGVRFAENTLLGSVGLLALTLLFGIGFASVSIAIALATGSVRATQSAFIIFFPLLFLTPSALPRELMTGWFETAVSINPMTYVIEAARSFLFAFNGAIIAKGFLAAALFSALTFSLTALAFRRRVHMG
ncbi:MAG TPA: ABC transporter permease [Actinomycetes bacterium]|nr:ABC transporter permease [Actinomycetes bacterium]